MNHYIHLESTVKLPLDETLTNVHPGCSLASPFIIHKRGINKSTFESFRTSFPAPSEISQLECLFTISSDKLSV